MNYVIGKALAILRRGGIISYPTETFYGLGVKFDLPDSLKKLYELKRRPKKKAMPVIIGDRRSLSDVLLMSLSPAAEALVEQFWPGPLTLLLPAKEGLSDYLTARTGKIAVRIPGESFALHLARRAGFPITATSANVSGMPPADDIETVMKYFGEDIDLLIDGGKTPGGAPSTIVDISEEGFRIVRQGAIRLP
ncbi:MAG TPA: L-threonylcarbamoyladenylate synthase [Thermodesulfovibrionales bacterium]|nr:L-threonylcarbamoyladenylate synthase [Thermodesulfovibrionales bacterium]